MTDEELNELLGDTIGQYREVTLAVLEGVDEENIPEVVEAMFRAICHELGHVEGLASLMGLSKEDRDEVRAQGRRNGLEEALAHHDEGPCEGCENSKELRSELYSN